LPAAPLPPGLVAFLARPRPAVVGTVRILLTMDRDSFRLQHLRAEPRVALTVLGDDWYNQLSILGRAVEFREDEGLADIDGLSRRYLGEPYEDRSYNGLSVLVEIDRWHTWGDPAAEIAPK